MQYKDGVISYGLHWSMRHVEQVVDEVWLRHGRDAVMTSGLDGDHGKWSWHYYGCAADFRTRYFTDSEIQEIADELRSKLTAPYQVVVEATHIHIEMDPVSTNMEWFPS